MSTESRTQKVERVLSSLGLARSREEELLGRVIVGNIGWFLALFVLLMYLLSSELRDARPEMLWWLGSYAAYLLLMEVLVFLKQSFYDTSLFRMVRVQLTIGFSTVLIWLTYGAQSPFWFVYLWPIFATTIFFERRWVTFAVFCESAILYLLASILTAGGLPGVSPEPLVVNISVTLVLSAVLHLLVENLRRYQAAEIEIEHLEALWRMQEDIDTAVDLQNVLDRILQAAVGLVGARDGSLMLMERDELRFRARFGRSLPEGKIERTFKPGEGAAGWVVETRRPYVCRDTRTDDHFAPIIAGMPIRSLVCVPIISHGVVLGVINVDSSQPDRFSGTDVQLLMILANHVAAAIERAQLWDNLGKIGEKILRGAKDLDEHIVDAVHQLTHCPVAMWQINEKNRTQATISAYSGLKKEYADKRVLDLTKSVTGKAIETAQPIEVEDIEGHPDVSPETKVEARRQGWKSLLVVPLMGSPARAEGTLSIYGLAAKRFPPWQIDLLSTFASQAGMALQSADRLQAIQRLSEIGQSLTALQESPETLPKTLERIANMALEVLGADLVDLYEYQADTNEFAPSPIMVGERRFPDFVHVEMLPDSVVVQIVRTGKPIYASRSQKHPVLASAWDSSREGRTQERFVVREEVVSSAGVLARVGEEILAVLFASYRQPRDWAAETELRERIEAFATFAGVAIQNARLLQRERTLRRQAETLREVSRSITTELKLEELAEGILDGLRRLVDYRKASIQLIRGDTRKLLARRGTDEEATDEWLLRAISEDPLIRRIVDGKQPLILSDPLEDPDWEVLPATSDVKSWIGLPLVYGNETIGLLTLDHDQPKFYAQNLESLLVPFALQAAIAISNTNLVEEISLLQKLGAQISKTLELSDILPSLVEGAMRLTQTTSGVVHVLDDSGQRFLRSYGYPQAFDHPLPRMSEGGYTSFIVNKKEQQVVKDAQTDERASRDVKRLGVRSFVGTPLKLEGERVVGVLYVNDTSVRHFTDRELSLLQALADQAAIAIENARLYEQRSKDIAALQMVNEAITAKSWTEIAALVAPVARELMHAEYSGLWRVEADHLVPGAMYGTGLMPIPELPIPELPSAATSINAWVARTGEPYVCFDVEDDPYYLEWREDVQSSMAVPMKFKGQIVGTLSAESTRPEAFSGYQIELLQSLANQAAIAFENARLYEQRREDISALQEINEAVVSKSPDEILNLIVEKAVAVMPGEYSELWMKEPGTGDLVLSAVHGPAAAAAREVGRLKAGTASINMRVAETKQLLISDNLDDAQGFYRIYGAAKSALTVPLKYQREVMGTLNVESARREVFTEQHAQLLDSFADQAAIALENARLYKHISQDLERRIRELEVLTEIGRTASNLGIDQILDLVYKNMEKIIELRDAQVQFAFYDETKDEVSFPLAVEQDKERGGIIDCVRRGVRESEYRRPDEDEIVEQFVPRARRKPPGLNEYVIRTEAPLLIVEEFEKTAEELGIQVWPFFGRLDRPTDSWLGVPMMVGGRVTGVISIQSLEQEHAFDQDHVQVLTAIANQSAVAIENARLLEREEEVVQERTHDLNVLYQTSREISQSLDLDTVMETVYEQVNKVIEAPTFFIALCDDDQKELDFKFCYDQGIPYPAGLGVREILADQGLTDYVVRTGQPLLISSYSEEKHGLPVECIPMGEAPYPESWVGVPLNVGGKMMGVLSGQNYEPKKYDKRHCELLSAIANQAAIAIENARLYTQLGSAFEQAESARRQAESAQASVRAMAGGYVHRLNGALGFIPSSIEAIIEEVGADIQDVLQDVKGGVIDALEFTARMTDLVVDQELPRESVNLDLMLRTVIHRFRIFPSEVRVVWELAPDLPEIMADTMFLTEVFGNLILNALEAMENTPHKELRIGGHVTDTGHVQIWLSDKGCGILEENLTKIFEPEYTTKPGKRGLGLWFCDTVIQAHSGHIDVNSEPGQGTTFTITLPVGG